MNTSSEQHRHRCEVRWCLRQGREWFERYIKGDANTKSLAAARKSREAAQRLWDDVRTQAAAGNTGKPGQWFEQQRETTHA